MTIVGYNDSICAYDINGDGIFKNEDINNNNVLDLSECEKVHLFLLIVGESIGVMMDIYMCHIIYLKMVFRVVLNMLIHVMWRNMKHNLLLKLKLVVQKEEACKLS